MTKKILYVYGGPEFHPTKASGELLTDFLKADSRFELEMTQDFDAFTKLTDGTYAGVVINTTGFDDQMTPEREQGLIQFVESGGGVVGVHSAIASFRGSKAYVSMLNAAFDWHPEQLDVQISIIEKDHYLTARVPNFTVKDELYMVKNFDPQRCTILANTSWQGKNIPLAWVRTQGKGRVAVLTNGHTLEVWKKPEFRKMLIRSIAWSCGADKSEKTINCAVLGYGPAFNMGKGHAEWINNTPGMKTIAMCDVVPARVEAAKKEIPGLQGYFTNVDDMLKLPDLDLVVNILPHNLHAPMTIKCLEANKHVVLEKPFCLNVDEATQMIDTARKNNRMLSVFQNRRWDGDYLTILDIIERGLIGDVFHIETFIGGYSHPSFWWRSDKAISGGVMFDWGAHFIDWILNMVPSRITQIMGDFQKRTWHSVTNEDHGQIYLRFANGITADFIVSSIMAVQRPKWTILGSKGAIQMMHGTQDIKVVSYTSGIPMESTVKVTLPPYTAVPYYQNIADHLLMGEELVVKPEQSRRVIGAVQAAEESSRQGVSVAPITGCE